MEGGVYESAFFSVAGRLFFASTFRKNWHFSASCGTVDPEAERYQPGSLCARTAGKSIPPWRL